MQRPRIGFFVPEMAVGGAEHVTVNVANGLAERGYDVDLLLAYPAGAFRGKVEDSIRVVDLDVPRVPGVGLGVSVPKLASYLRSTRPDVLFSAMTHANVVALAAKAVSNASTRAVPVEHLPFSAKSATKDAVVLSVAKFGYAIADGVVAVSEGVAESVARNTRVDGDDVRVLYNPIPTGEIYERSKGPVTDAEEWFRSDDFDVVLGVGRLEDQKDFATLIGAFDRVRTEVDDARLVIVGEGSGREELLALVADLGLSDVVSLPGFVDDVYPYMGRASVFALSSRNEGLPTVLVEAMACGCPVVATDCPSGPREILEAGEHGPLVPVGDERALAEAIRAVLSDPPEGRALRERAADFSFDAVLDDYEAFIEDLLGPGRGDRVAPGSETER